MKMYKHAAMEGNSLKPVAQTPDKTANSTVVAYIMKPTIVMRAVIRLLVMGEQRTRKAFS
jgi:hypothetical protein